MFLNGSLNQPSSELALGSVKPDVVNPPMTGHAPGLRAIPKAARQLDPGRKKFLPFSNQPHSGRCRF